MAKGGKKKRGAEEEMDTQAWMVTFSDLSTLLLTFFVLLLSMSSMNELKMKSMFHNFTSSCGILAFKEYGEIAHPRESLISSLAETLKDALVVRRDEDQEESMEIPSESAEKLFKGASGSLVFQEIKGGFKLVFGQALLFNSGSAEIKDGARPVLMKIARFMRRSSYQIYIDGYTDNVPIHTESYDSNRALSLARAYNVMHYFVTDEKLSPESIAIGGYGASHPVASNDSIIGRAKNRRVEMIFKNQKYF
ncbi:MAG: flagellar motor protein MotB [Desulfatiglandaceae bacterium]